MRFDAQTYSPNELVKARIGSQRIELWLHEQPRQIAGTRLVTLLHPRECLIIVAKGSKYVNDERLVDVFVRCSLGQLRDNFPRLVALTQESINTADLSHDPRPVVDLAGALQLR